MKDNRQLRVVSLACAVGLAFAAFAQAGVLYTYDDLGRVKSITYDDGKRVTYTYDPSGNRTQHVIDQLLNTPPVAVADDTLIMMPSFSTANVEVLLNDSDADQDFLAVQNVTTPTYGSATILGGSSVWYSYFGAGPYPVIDSFSYTISDGRGGTATATVSISIDQAPQCDPMVEFCGL